MNSAYKADKICMVLYNSLSVPIEAKILSIFENALNIKYESSLITIIPKGRPIYPNSVVLSQEIDFTKLGLKQNMSVLITKEYLKTEKFKVKFIGAKKIDLSILSVSGLDYPIDLKNRLETIKTVVINSENGEGISPIISRFDEKPMPDNVYTTFLTPRIDEFLLAIKNGETSKISEKVSDIAGCGIGLTPSSDDFLCGFMAAYIVLAKSKKSDMNDTLLLTNKIAQSAVAKTNFISGEFLKSSAKGQLGEDTLTLMGKIFSCSDLQQCENAALNVAKFGATSGTDILCGIYFALNNLN